MIVAIFSLNFLPQKMAILVDGVSLNKTAPIGNNWDVENLKVIIMTFLIF